MSDGTVYVPNAIRDALGSLGVTVVRALEEYLRSKGRVPRALPDFLDCLPSYPPGVTVQEILREHPYVTRGAVQWALTSDPRVARARCTEPRGRAKGRPPWRYWIPSDVAPVAPPTTPASSSQG